MRTPIVLDNQGDMSAYLSVAEAERQMEATDVRGGAWAAWDADGTRLAITIVEDPPRTGPLGVRHAIERVALQPTAEQRPDDLLMRARDFLARVGAPAPANLEAAIRALVDLG